MPCRDLPDGDIASSVTLPEMAGQLSDEAMATFTRASHIGLSVCDRHKSAEWYERTLGFKLLNEFKTGIPRILMLHPESGFAIGLYNHAERSGDKFSPLRTGLDHIALQLEDREQLDAWINRLDAVGVEHSPVHDLGHAMFISLEDPDGIQFELWVQITPPANAFQHKPS